MEGFPYRGHYIWIDPEKKNGDWEARVAVEIHAKGEIEKIYYNDHLYRYTSREEALEACKEFGKRLVDNFTIPDVGEGEYKEER
jgi:hypothetical protein